MSDAPEGRGPGLRAVGLAKSYPSPAPGGRAVMLFRDVHLAVSPGEMVGVVGRSGAGKSSLLHLLAGLERPDAGEVWVGGIAVHTAIDAELNRLRNCDVGYVWQFHYLLPEFSALENVALPLMARGLSRAHAEREARGWLERVELGARLQHRSGELSGGEQQRVAIARALVTGPGVLLADEPTGDLDEGTAAQLMDMLDRLRREHALAVLLVTHNGEVAGRCDRVLRLVDGRLEPVAARLA